MPKNMIAIAKKDHAARIAKKITLGKDQRLIKGYEKDLLKLNYTTLVALSPRVK